MSLPHEIARINRIDSLTEDAMNQMQITAQTVHQISDLALTPALDRNYLAEIQAADTEHNERERKLKSVERFIQRLPIARGENEYSLGNSYFSNPDLSELRKTEATAWWLGVRQKRDFEFAGFIDLAIKAASPSNYQFMPTYIIGEKQDIPKNGSSDALTTLLLASAIPINQSYLDNNKLSFNKYSTLAVSTIEKERAEQLTVHSLAETLNEDQIKERYHVLIEGDAKSGRLLLYRLAEQKVRSLKKSGISEPKQLQVPADEDYRKNFYASLDKKIMKKGVSAGKASGVELTLDVIQEFNIPLHTFKLATMLGRESEHARMVSTLTGSKRKY